MIIILLITLLVPIHPLKVFEFDSSQNSAFSKASLESSFSLSEGFTMCGSFKQKTVTNQGFLTVYGGDEKPFLSISSWYAKGEIIVWLYVTGTWKLIAQLEAYWITLWSHICITLYLTKGEVDVFLNDFRPVTLTDFNLKKNIPKDLKGNLFIGIADDTSGLRQFEGKVANLVLIDEKEDIQSMVKNLCDSHSQDGKTILSWNFTGNIEQYNSQSWEVCNQNKTYIVANGAGMNFEDAFRTCSRIWSGVMTLPNSRQHLNSLMSVFKGGHCKRVWIPISDEEVEGSFKSVEDGKLVSYLPWASSEPNSGKEGKMCAFGY